MNDLNIDSGAVGIKLNSRQKSGLEEKGIRRRYTRGFIRAQNKRQLRREMVPDRSLIVGMDLAHKSHCIWFSTVQKEPLDYMQISNNCAGMDALVKRAIEIQKRDTLEKTIFAMEPTGHYWMPVSTYLENQGFSYVLVQPLSVKRERQSSYYRYAKNDYKDAELIANLTADRKFTFTRLPQNDLWAGLKSAAKEYLLTEMNMSIEQLRLHSWLERLYPEYSEIFKDVCGQSAIGCWLSFPSLSKANEVEFLAEVRHHSQSRIYPSKVKAFYRLASITPPEWGAPVYVSGLSLSIAHAAQRYRLLEQQHRKAEEELLQWYEQTGYAPYSNSIPHLSATFHAAILGLAGDPLLYDSSRCLTKQAGVDIKENQSGDYQGQTPITHGGNALMRYLTYLSGYVLKTHEPVFQKRYQYLTTRPHRPLKKNQAIIALGCKYLRILWTLCTQKSSYNPQKAEGGINC